MKKIFALGIFTVALVASTANAQAPVTVGGAPMCPNKNIIENAVNSKDHTTLVAAVKAAGLVDTLQGPGPFTVFAPVNATFMALPAGTVDTLLKPESKSTLTAVHVPRRAGEAELAGAHAPDQGENGKAMLKTVQGEELTAMLRHDMIAITDAKGGTAMVSIAHVTQSNGVIHVIDKVLPRPGPHVEAIDVVPAPDRDVRDLLYAGENAFEIEGRDRAIITNSGAAVPNRTQ